MVTPATLHGVTRGRLRCMAQRVWERAGNMMTCLCSCERGGDALTGRGWYPGKPFLFVVLLDTCIFDTFALAAALLSIGGFQIDDRDCFLRAIRLTAGLLSRSTVIEPCSCLP